MKRTVILLGVGLSVMTLSLTAASTRAYAQRGEATVGDSVTLIVPAGVYKDANTQIVVTGPAKAPKAVGNCGARGSVISDPSRSGCGEDPADGGVLRREYRAPQGSEQRVGVRHRERREVRGGHHLSGLHRVVDVESGLAPGWRHEDGRRMRAGL